MAVGSVTKIIRQATVQTTDATDTTLLDIAIPSNCSGVLRGYIIGQKTDGTTRKATIVHVMVRNAAGTLSVTVEAVPITIDPDTSLWSGTVVVSGTNVRFTVIGTAATTVRWGFIVEGQHTQWA